MAQHAAVYGRTFARRSRADVKKDARLELRLDGELRAKVDELAKRSGIAASAVVRRSILASHRAAFPDAPVAVRSPLQVRTSPGAREAVPNSLSDLHTSLWGRSPSSQQQAFYASFGRGFTDGVTEEQLDSVLTMAFALAPMRPVEPIFVLAPSTAKPAILQRIAGLAVSARTKPLASIVRAAAKRMYVLFPRSWWPTEPPIWVAFGLAFDETFPKWLRRRLVQVAP